MILSAPQLMVLALVAVGTGYALSRSLHARLLDGRCEGLLQDIDQLRRSLAASRSEIAARERDVRAEQEEVERLDAQLTSAEIERAELRARLARHAAANAAAPARRAPRAMSARASAAESPVTPAEGPHSETPSALHPPADDDLERIRGIGPTIARRLRAHGVRSYRDIMEWSDADLARVAAAIRAPLGRVRRDHWPEQARDLELQKPGVAVPA